LRELGVAEAIDYTTTRFEDVARAVDVVFDTAASDTTAPVGKVRIHPALPVQLPWGPRAAKNFGQVSTRTPGG